MYSLAQRANSVFAFSLTVIFVLLGAVAIITPFLPFNPTTEVHVRDIAVWTYDYGGSISEIAFVTMDLEADLTSLFNWNTKQLYVSIVAEYESDTYNVNQIILWDDIIRSKRDARIVLHQLKNKYIFNDINPSFREINATYALHWDAMPYAGLLQSGRSKSIKRVKFPKPENMAS
ncbi:8936_t:CDS:2 [Paraglomus brasilianum]|uniref:Signal peptidase subunit 3 n=1 Tax=Paraglomus brasilianum TaxID=144538 RepID=A0A9N9AIJ3_9GLOM|nr:8936_t:CDS:2 [Paraglomus brasilianum]